VGTNAARGVSLDEPQKKPLSISPQLYELLQANLKASGAANVEELVSRIIRDWISERGNRSPSKQQGTASDKDGEAVEERLRLLGYL